MKLFVGMNSLLQTLLHSCKCLMILLQLLLRITPSLLNRLSLLTQLHILCLQLMILSFVPLALLLQLVHSFLDISVLLLQELDKLTCLIDCVLHHLAITFLASHRYYNMP